MSHECPRCGASIRNHRSCPYCGGDVDQRTASDRIAEQQALAAKQLAWDERIQQAEVLRAGDYVVPPLGCIGTFILIFVCGAIVSGVVNGSGKTSENEALLTMAVACAGAIVALVLIMRSRASRRRARVAELRAEAQRDPY